MEVIQAVKTITTTEEFKGIIAQPHAFLFVNAEWSMPSIRGKQILETEWWPSIQKELGLSQPVFEVDIDSELFVKVLAPRYLEPNGYILGGAGEFLWFRNGKLVDLAIGTLGTGYQRLLARTKTALNLEI